MLTIRVAPQLHRMLLDEAYVTGASLNRLCIEKLLKRSDLPVNELLTTPEAP